MAKIYHHHWRGPVKHEYQTKYGGQFHKHGDDGHVISSNPRHYKNVPRHHRK